MNVDIPVDIPVQSFSISILNFSIYFKFFCQRHSTANTSNVIQHLFCEKLSKNLTVFKKQERAAQHSVREIGQMGKF